MVPLVIAGLLFLGLVAAMGLSPIFTLGARQGRVNAFTYGPPGSVSLAMTTTSASPDVTAVGDMLTVSIGSFVTGAGIPVGTTIIAMDNSAHTATLSHPATASASITATVTGSGGPLLTQQQNFRLFKDGFNPSVGMVLADLAAVECDFDGYDGKVLNMTIGYVDGTSTPFAQSQLLSFIKSAGVNANNVGGWWIDDGTNVICAAKYNITVPMATTGAELSGVFQDGYPSGSGWAPLIPANA